MDLVSCYRIGRKQGDKRRPVLMEAKNSQDKLRILNEGKNLREKNLGLWMTQDFPFGIRETRRKLIPTMLAARKEGRQVKLVEDRLYIDGTLYRGDDISKEEDNEGVKADDRIERGGAMGRRNKSVELRIQRKLGDKRATRQTTKRLKEGGLERYLSPMRCKNPQVREVITDHADQREDTQEEDSGSEAGALARTSQLDEESSDTEAGPLLRA